MDNKFLLPKKAERIIVLQRIELASPLIKRLRKLFGRYIFSNFITKFFLDKKKISQNYYRAMVDEYFTIKDFIKNEDTFFLSIGSGIGGLEVIINDNLKDKSFYFIERDYISKKVKYGWGGMINHEAYNNFELQRLFLEMNNFDKKKIHLFDYDKDEFPKIKFDIVTSLFSLDYHYDFNIYIDYLKKISTPKTKIIFDTIRADYFNGIFKNVKIISTNLDTVHKSNRIICSNFIN